jgi:hypothetical protein
MQDCGKVFVEGGIPFNITQKNPSIEQCLMMLSFLNLDVNTYL